MSDIDKDNWDHEFNLVTGYCIHCGMSIAHQCDPPIECHRTENVTAISHLVSPKRIKDIFNELRTSIKNLDPNSK
jgi:hypothetical protein